MKKRTIKEKLETIDQHLANAEEYVARNVNVVSSAAWLHTSDWKGKSGHPLWVKNQMIPGAKRRRAKLERAQERVRAKVKDRRTDNRRRRNIER